MASSHWTFKARGARSETLSFLRQEKVKPLKYAPHFDDGLNLVISLFSNGTFFKIWRYFHSGICVKTTRTTLGRVTYGRFKWLQILQRRDSLLALRALNSMLFFASSYWFPAYSLFCKGLAFFDFRYRTFMIKYIRSTIIFKIWSWDENVLFFFQVESTRDRPITKMTIEDIQRKMSRERGVTMRIRRTNGPRQFNAPRAEDDRSSTSSNTNPR